MDDLIAFLSFVNARLDEDEQTASAATDGPWLVDSQQYAEVISASDGTTVVGGGRWGGEASVFESTEDAMHIARHDPARVLTEVDAKRQIIELHQPITDPTPPFKNTEGFLCSICTAAGGAMYDQQRGILFTDLTVFPCRTLRLLALPYTDHPDYRDEWRP